MLIFGTFLGLDAPKLSHTIIQAYVLMLVTKGSQKKKKKKEITPRGIRTRASRSKVIDFDI